MRLSVCGIAVEGPHQLYVNLALSNKIMMITTVTLMMMTMTMMIIVMMIMDPHVFSCVFHSFFQVSGIGARDLWGTLRNNSQIKLQKQDNMIPPDVKVMVLSYGRGE